MSEQNPAPNSETNTAGAPPNVETTSSIDHTVEPQHGQEERQEEQEVKEVKHEEQEHKEPENAAEGNEVSSRAANDSRVSEEDSEETNDDDEDDDDDDTDDDSTSASGSEEGEGSESISGESAGEGEGTDETDGNTSNDSSGDDSASEEEEGEEPVAPEQSHAPINNTAAPSATHTRNISLSSNGSHTSSTIILVKTTLETILNDKDMKKHSNAQKAIERTLQKFKEFDPQTSNPHYVDSILVFEALRASCRTKSSRIQNLALDCLSKLFSFRSLDEKLLVNPPDSLASNDQQQDAADGITPPPKQKIIDAAIDTISDCFQGEGTDERVELQIVRALSSCILEEDSGSLCHGASLLKAIRTIYNVFVFSLNASNQGIAQATLTQIISSVYDKVDLKQTASSTLSLSAKNHQQSSGTELSELSDNVETPVPLTLENMDKLNDDEERLMDSQQPDFNAITNQDLAVKDAFLVFRVMAKICAKPLETELDMRSHAVRSKLLSLHIIYSIIKDHIDVFLSHNIFLPGKERICFIDSIRQYLRLVLSRNAASPLAPVFEVTLEIMWLLIANLRADFVKEIPVFLTEIYFPISELTTSTSQQKRYFLSVIQRICNDPRTLVEFYLNYDCNPGMPNVVEITVDYLTRLALTRVEITQTQRSYYDEQISKSLSTYDFSQLPLLTSSNLSSSPDIGQINLLFPLDFALKMVSLNCIVSVLRSLSSWAHKALNPNQSASKTALNTTPCGPQESRSSLNDDVRSSAVVSNDDSRPTYEDEESKSLSSQNVDTDDPTQFENLKLRKTALSECIAIFNNKPKKAIPVLIQKGFMEDDSATSIAKWLLETEGLDMAAIGDYLGEGDDKNIAIMHAFVDEFDFTGMSIVDALRSFLQKFRLPGEGQKIDRFMLKFAERFVDQNPGIFSKADTAYVLSYSLIMLNTDLHSSRIKNKMSLQEFLENNEGIDNGRDLPKEFLEGLFNEIAKNEIKLLSEQHQAMLSGDTNVVQQQQQQSAFNFFNSRDLTREAYNQVSKEISSKTELVFKNLNRSKNKRSPDIYYAASHVEHVKSIFETLWMSFLAALSPPFKEYDDTDTTNKCLEGLKISIKIASTFRINDARTSFVGALVQFCNLQNLEEIKVKNVNAMVILLEVALSEGNYLEGSWKDILLVVSQMERLQLISKGIDRDTVPDVAQARFANPRVSYESTRSNNTSFFDVWGKKATPTELAQEKHHNQTLSPEISKFISSSELVVLMDNIFTKSSELSGNAIVEFIKALTAVSLEEIESSENASTPRMFSLQKMVDVCYYNMDRIKLEWTPLWAVMGKAFKKIATNSNLAVVFFAIDSLRQLSMRFLDIEELSGFEFQHDFLKPFEYTVQNSGNTEVQEMIIECFRNFILTKSERIKSGWKPILESLQYTARSGTESIVLKTQLLVSNDIVTNHFEDVFSQEDAFSELVGVFREITKNKRFQKLSLHALESLRKMTQNVAEICFYNENKGEEERKHNTALLRGKDIFQDVWFPMLFCFNDTIMTAEDLEVRSRALNYMFDALVAYGSKFNDEFWEKICKKLLFPIFGVLSKHWEVNQFNSHDDLSVWLSTTLIQALRNLIALFTHYFESLNKMLDGFLGLLVSCICQENDTIARIGRSCLQQLILQNVTKFNEYHWNQIGDVFDKLFDLTTANELFDYDPLQQGRKPSVSHHQTTNDISQQSDNDNNDGNENDSTISETVERAHQEESSEDVGGDMVETLNGQNGETKLNNDNSVAVVKEESNLKAATLNVPKRTKNMKRNESNEDIRRRINVKNSIVVKCVLQLLMIELLNELFENEDFAHCIPYKESIRITRLLEKSYEFSRDFNEDYGLRTRLVEARVVDKIPNLLKQETSAAAVLLDIMFQLYLNDDEKKADLIVRLIGICIQVVEGYVSLDDRTMERSINAWRSVIVEILQGYYEFDDEDFRLYCPAMYALVIQILDKSVPTELRHAVKQFLSRVGELYLSTD
ncbi:hypothetical protein SUVZ_02G2930 [Saccharomyces uvarum]|uniref:SEC7 domain-containing protein n=1 Tax=Saccharomyces uvarum TaxID=230603 RepID=A0ABN8WUM5_SACUV|nr:hypothetical protein SUVZ_02G2930 [Saccharomyces uvarum]